jgi:accessory gene regulator protein AgrB
MEGHYTVWKIYLFALHNKSLLSCYLLVWTTLVAYLFFFIDVIIRYIINWDYCRIDY